MPKGGDDTDIWSPVSTAHAQLLVVEDSPQQESKREVAIIILAKNIWFCVLVGKDSLVLALPSYILQHTRNIQYDKKY
jgi:hypothetical protein